ncbi:hypothetical protein NECAME_00131 [Necator americanus]|uniref:Kelch repeat protein n=1 Tax=Necator americanus TaxID=51031 RepID=W2U1T4_NECAM|nr:hypothetical protein NECAME_00131 [Necator americanus]ETN87272.1 hypothetical protein NECAME_00131 [Necator americanus]
MQVNTEDITVSWGQQPHPLDSTYGKWRMAVFQDVQESIDMSKLYFLYDPIADEGSGTSGTRKGYPGLVIFDVNFRCFAGEIPLHAQGINYIWLVSVRLSFAVLYFLALSDFSVHRHDEVPVFSQVPISSRWLCFCACNGGADLWTNPLTNCRPLLNQPLSIGGEYIASMREDAPEIVVMANPGLQVWRINAMAEQPQAPTSNFTVPGAELQHFYDGFLSNGSVHLLSSSPDGHLDHSRVHVLNLNAPGQITTHNCTPDPQRGMPQPRKNAGIDGVANAILLAGGEIDHGNYNVERLVDYWMLDTRTFQWLQIPAQMPCPLIEPRLTACNSGNIYLWGDFDQPLPGMPAGGTHLRIMKVSGMDKAGHPPSYSQTVSQPPAYPTQSPYPQQGGGAAPPYPSYNPAQSNPGYVMPQSQQQQQYPGYGGGGSYGGGYGDQGGYGGPTEGFHQVPAGPNQTAYYPLQKSKKDCSIQ